MGTQSSIEKVTWDSARKRVAAVHPTLAKAIDALSPGKDMPLYRMTYPYGASLLDQGVWSVSAQAVASELQYAVGGMPMALVLTGAAELFLSLPDRVSPWCLLKPGELFPPVVPVKALQMTAGARSLFFVPHISDAYHHKNLLRDFSLRMPAPKELLQQWHLFKALVAHPANACDWQLSLLCFPDAWVKRIHHDPAWQSVQQLLFMQTWQKSLYQREQVFYHLALSCVQATQHGKPNPYLIDTFKHLLAITAGAVPGFSVAMDDSCAPVNLLQQIYVRSYGLRKYAPTMMQPSVFSMQQEMPVYYSLQVPTTVEFSPKSRKASNTLNDLRELQQLTQAFMADIQQQNSILYETSMAASLQQVRFDFFHSKPDPHDQVQLTDTLPQYDPDLFSAEFAKVGTFMRGCIRIGKS